MNETTRQKGTGVGWEGLATTISYLLCINTGSITFHAQHHPILVQFIVPNW